MLEKLSGLKIMMYNKEVLEEIRQKVDLLTYLENYGIAFRRTGAAWVGLCPVHSERSPSFNVNPNSQTFKCFGCGISGDIFSLIQELQSLSFPGAVQYLADEVGIKLEINDDPEYKKRQRLLMILRMTSEWYRHNYMKLPDDHPARLNLKDRDLLFYSSKDDSVGFAPAGDLVRLLKEKNFTDNEIIEAGVAIRNEQTNIVRERFRNRLVWTIYNVQGHPIAFSARKIFDEDQGPKYINSPQTPLYNKSKALLGINSAKRAISKDQVAYVVEGQTDVMALKDAGFEGTVASCGTAFGKEHASMLLHLSKMGQHANRFEIVFCFDGDLAGTKAAKKVFAENPNIQLNSYAVKFLNREGEPTDPCDYRTAYGNTALNDFINNHKVPLIEFILAEMKSEWVLTSPEGKSGYITAALNVLDLVTDSIQHAAYLRKIAAWSGVTYVELTSISRSRRNKPQQTAEEEAPMNTDQKIEVSPETSMLAALVQFPKEGIHLVAENEISADIFSNHTHLAEKILGSVASQNFDYNDPEYLELAHFNLNIASDRVPEGLSNLLKHFYRSEYAKHSALLDAELLTPGIDPVVAFNSLLEKQEVLKTKYRQ